MFLRFLVFVNHSRKIIAWYGTFGTTLTHLFTFSDAVLGISGVVLDTRGSHLFLLISQRVAL